MVVDAGDKAAEAGGVGARSEALEHGDGPRVDYGQRADDGQRAELPVLDAYGLSFGYGSERVWDQVDVALYAGEIGYLTGPNGAGKTTLLRCLAGWMSPRSGQIDVMGERFTGRSRSIRRQIAFVADVPAFYEDLTAREHIDFVLRANRAEREVVDRAERMLEAFGIAEFCNAYPSAFSRGMRQKLALVIALMMKPKLVLMDEPTGPLDPDARVLLGKLVQEAARDGAAVLLSCHHELPGVAPDVVYDLRDGRLREVDAHDSVVAGGASGPGAHDAGPVELGAGPDGCDGEPGTRDGEPCPGGVAGPCATAVGDGGSHA